MPMTRRDLLKAAGFAAVANRFIDDTSQRAASIISGYSAEGFHRTATDVDRKSADRLLAHARAAGASPKLEPFELSRVDPGPAFLDIAGHRIDGLPMFDGAFTDGDGIRGTIGAAGGDAAIGLTRIAPTGEAALRGVRDRSPNRAFVAVTMGRRPGLCPVNAAFFVEPFGPPVLQVASEHADALDRASRSRDAVRLVAQAERRAATAFNVVADVDGTRADLAPVCVMTPRSGWYSNASERGGGLVCWLEAMRAVAAARPLRTVRFVASSGHELGHLGLHAYLKQRSSLAHDAHVWLHFGANLPAATVVCSHPELEQMATGAFAAQQHYPLSPRPAARVGGEAATIGREGGRFISFIGESEWFHNPHDRWPGAVNVAAVSRFAKGAADLALALANQLS